MLFKLLLEKLEAKMGLEFYGDPDIVIKTILDGAALNYQVGR